MVPETEFKINVQGTEIPCLYTDKAYHFNSLKARNNILGLDIETYASFPFEKHPQGGLNRHLSRIGLIQIYDGEKVVLYRPGDCPSEEAVHFIMNNKFVAHNALFELHHLSPDAWRQPRIACSQIMDRLVLGSQQVITKAKIDSCSLQQCVKRWLGLDIDKSMQMSDWSGELSTEQLQYASLDAIVTKIMADKLFPALKQRGMGMVYAVNRDAQKPLTQMAINGMDFDVEMHNNLVMEWLCESDKVESELRETLGPDINMRSAAQLSDWCLNKYSDSQLKGWPVSPKTGHLQFNADALAYLGHIPFVGALLRYKKYQKALNTYGESFVEKYVNPVTGRVHGSFTLCQTDTGRMSSRNPNLQNQPRAEQGKMSMRDCFIAPSKHKLVIADYSQVELRTAAEISQDSRMLKAYAEGDDLHMVTARGLAGGEATKDDRQKAKAVNFGLLFGAGAATLQKYAKKSYQVDMSDGDAQKAVKAFRSTYPEYRTWQQVQAENAMQSLKAYTPLGRCRFLPQQGSYTRSMNTPVQGGAAEVMLLALIELHATLKEGKLTNCVHDEIIIEAYPGQEEICKRKLCDAMVKAWLSVFPGATSKGLVEANIGKSWSEAK